MRKKRRCVVVEETENYVVLNDGDIIGGHELEMIQKFEAERKNTPIIKRILEDILHLFRLLFDRNHIKL